jgi:hypothetical protein
MEWSSPLFVLLTTLPNILQCQQNVSLDIAIRHAQEILHTSLWPLPVHILQCPYKWKSGFLYKYKAADLIVAPVFGFFSMNLKIKWL